LLALLARLEVEGNAPPSSSRLANLVVPIFAGTPTQQAVCHERWQAMFGPGDTGPVRHIHQQSAPRDSDRATQRRWWLQSAFASIGAITGVILLVLAGVIALGSLNRLFWPPLANERQQVSPEGAAGRIPDLIQEFPIKELQPPEQSPWNRTWRWYYTEYDWKKWIVAGFPWFLYAAAIGVLIYLTLAHLRREALKEKLKSLPWSFRGEVPRLGDRALLADLQPLRTLARDHTLELDPVLTALATAERGGMLAPRYRSKPVPYDFVALIDRRSPRDHLASYAETVVAALRSAGVFVEQFDFDRVPWVCRRTRTGELEKLESIVTSLSQSIFLLFTSPAALYNPGTGEPHTWLAELQQVSNKFLIVPETERAGTLKDDTMMPGLPAIQTAPDGLRQLASWLL